MLCLDLREKSVCYIIYVEPFSIDLQEEIFFLVKYRIY